MRALYSLVYIGYLYCPFYGHHAVASVNVECMNMGTCLLSVGSGQTEAGTR